MVYLQGCGVGVEVGVTRSSGNEPGVGVGVGVDHATSTPTPGRLVQYDPVSAGDEMLGNIVIFYSVDVVTRGTGKRKGK